MIDLTERIKAFGNKRKKRVLHRYSAKDIWAMTTTNRDGELYTNKWFGQAREMIGSQMARLIYMFEYAIKNYGLKPTQQIITVNGIKYKRI